MTSIPAPSRRAVVLGLGGAALAGAVPAVAAAPASAGYKPTLDAFADELLRLDPQQATSLGVDVGARAPLRAELTHQSDAAFARYAEQARSMRTRAAAIDRGALAPLDRVRLDAVAYAADRAIEGTAFPYGRGAADGLSGGATPYTVTQQNGAVNSVPEFLNSTHPVRTEADAEAWLSRMTAMGGLLDEETALIREAAGRGVVPPSFVAANALGILRKFRAVQPGAQPMVESLEAKARKAGLKPGWSDRASKIVATSLYPALDRQIAAYAKATAGASDVAGCQRLPDGAAYYRWALRLGTTTTRPADEIHRIGLDQNRALIAEIDALLTKQGLTQGSVGQRVQALNKDPRFLYPDTDAGRADLIAYLNGRIAAIRPMMPKLSHLPLRAEVQVKRVPPDIQDGAALGYMNFASLDGNRPAIYYVNLKSTSLWPRYQLATLTAHEGIPGHTWQGAYIAESKGAVPLVMSLFNFNAFTEGWALYAEQLVDENGLYADDPFGRIGYLQAQQFRACRLVADTGLHSKGWTREQAVSFLVEQTGKGRDAMTSEVDRYCVAPGQACGYKTGHNEILRLREQAKRALGPRFDLAGFDDAVVTTGGVPLALLPAAVDNWIAARRG